MKNNWNIYCNKKGKKWNLISITISHSRIFMRTSKEILKSTLTNLSFKEL